MGWNESMENWKRMVLIQIVGILLLFGLINKVISWKIFILTKVVFVLVIYTSQKETFGNS